jgi:hypothetical protein
MERFGQHVLRDTVGAIWESGEVDLGAHIVTVSLSPGDEKISTRSLDRRACRNPSRP